jgi:hypothetical protein
MKRDQKAFNPPTPIYSGASMLGNNCGIVSEMFFSEVASRAELIEDHSSVAVVLRDSVILVRKRRKR